MMLDVARRHRDRGRPVFPCGTDKRPLVATGFLAATMDDHQIVEWWSRWPWAWPAWPTGDASGFVVVDIDAKPNARGDVTFAELIRDRGPVPHTEEILTPSGGAHLVYAMPPGIEIRNSQSRIGRGIDVRGSGGYVMGDGAGPSNARYVRLDNGAPLAVLDGWLLDAAMTPTPAATTPPTTIDGRWGSDYERRVARAVAYVDRMEPAIAGAGGHNALWLVAVRLVRGLELPDDAARLVLQHYSARCSPPWSEREIAHKLEQAKRSTLPAGFMECRS